MKFDDLPKNYSPERLKRKDLLDDPKKQLILWLGQAKEANVAEFNAMCLATCTLQGKPSCRTVLLKEIDETGLHFFTNYNSRKSRELEENPRAMATLFWGKLMRQASFEGTVVKAEEEVSKRYFASRPRGSRLGAWASPQDSVIPSYAYLQKSYEELEKKYQNQEIPLPPFWGGFRLVPDRFEFWQGGKDRLHDRFQYIKAEGGWKIERLAP